MFLAHGARLKHAAGGIERIDSRIDTQFRDRARKHGGCVQVGERRGRRRVGQVVSGHRSEEHTSELQSLMRISYAVFCLKKKIITKNNTEILVKVSYK